MLVFIAAAGSAALLIGALGFQYIGGMPPCHLCYLQRYPHMVAVVIGVVALFLSSRLLPIFGALAALTSANIGVYHTGVERGWWEGPTTCTSGAIDGLSADALLQQIMAAPMVRCDDVAWQMLGLSMASWNAIASLVLALIWITAARRKA
ncbi:hypothetical protein P775_28295 [Puniceibacterium antarcticum]|uniref:Dihydroneopterin aldolase n=1 Tax=Puniceibacterium antarcticum TaxID=1206336 RepID=A0A2G8QSY5_9RHOB|nr:hypothetical protein P775_28295 [Puniceibacterium antarcticum]